MARPYPAGLLLPSDAYDTGRHQVMGRRVAGLQLARALSADLAADERLTLVGTTAADLQGLATGLQPLLRPGAQLQLSTRLDPAALATLGCLHLPDPGLGHWCQLRDCQSGHAWSLSGVIHTLCSKVVTSALEQLLTAPLHPWDALVCTSSAGRQVVQTALDGHHEALQRRFGTSLPRPAGPQLPLIPLAIDPAPYDWRGRHRSRAAQRQWARQQLHLPPDALVVLFVGRLSFHSKAHPQPLYRALAQLAAGQQQQPVVLLECGHLFNASIGEAFDALATQHTPLQLRRLGGLQPASEADKQLALAAADLFCSPADNLQETFGLSLLEAMAAELPVVASDWSGYRDLVEHGVSGLLVPSADALAGAPLDQLDIQYRLGFIDYDTMVGLRSLAVCVDPAALLQALTALQQNPLQRQAMGVAGRKRLEQRFSAAVVARQYRALWQQLAALRQAAAAQQPNLAPAPTRVPYSRLFAGFGSAPLHQGPWQRRSSSAAPAVLLDAMQRMVVERWGGAALATLVQWLAALPLEQPLTASDLEHQFRALGIAPEHQRPLLACLLKLAVLEPLGQEVSA
ncbi:MAG: glycosyltransferase family 4 protein [Cyanobacteriota bacterium]|nr:glycosyltransferase family 4 protein [Cyanobacteriota bacterium]